MRVEYKYTDNDVRVFEIDPVKVVRQDGNAVIVEYVETNGETHNLLLPLMNLRFIDVIFKEDVHDVEKETSADSVYPYDGSGAHVRWD